MRTARDGVLLDLQSAPIIVSGRCEAFMSFGDIFLGVFVRVLAACISAHTFNWFSATMAAQERVRVERLVLMAHVRPLTEGPHRAREICQAVRRQERGALEG